MSVPVIAFFNSTKGGVGKTSLVYHLAWMFGQMDQKVLAADLDPQANLTAAFLDDDRLESLWPDESPHTETIYGAVEPLIRGVGDIVDRPHLEPIAESLSLLPGDPALSLFEQELSEQWPKCLGGGERAFRVMSAFWRIIQRGAASISADLVLVDLGPNLGAINRAAVIAADYLIVPLAPDLFSLQGLKNLGSTVANWREGWRERKGRNPDPQLVLPVGGMTPSGYVILQHGIRLDRPVKAYERWINRVPAIYSESLLGRPAPDGLTIDRDPECLALLKHYRSLMPLAQEAHKPIFDLKPADGALGAHLAAVRDARRDFERLAKAIAERCFMQGSGPPAALAGDGVGAAG